ncbi:MAG TPA: 1-acyl-sn-glycerol-3-phosphate acyltransferase [Chitinophagaceae bacterium]|nr:1-acyl-sn-glycerol-3-phosphate acyltransferase [Chitinophagaceae bacterium]
MTPALSCYFRKSSFLGANRIPAKGPVVVISNHAASFLDAIVMGVMLKRSIHFYARGDIFKKPWVRYVLGQLHMIPIFSADLAKNDLHRNARSFDKGAEVLKNGGLLLIFPEGLSRLERNIMPLKKGASRIILQAVDSSEETNVKVVPIGIHYSKHAFRADLQMVVGEVLDASRYRQDYRENPPKTVNALTEVLEDIFREVVLYVQQNERSLIIEQQLEMLSNEQNKKFSYDIFKKQKNLCDTVSMMDDQRIRDQKQLQDSYFSQLGYQELNDRCFTGGTRNALPFIFLMLGFPLFVAGALINIIPYLFGRYMADKKVTRADFYTSVLVAVSAFSYVIWLLIWMIVGIKLDSDLILLIFAFSPFLAWIALWWMDEFKKWKFQNRFDTLSSSEPELIKKLGVLRSQVRDLDPDHRHQLQVS